MKKKVFFEDATMQYNKWVQGIASREQASGKITLFDLFDQNNKQIPGETDNPVYIPIAMTNVTAIIGSLLTDNANFQDKLRITWSSPYCKESKRNREILRGIFAQSKQIDKIVQDIVKQMDILVEKPKKESNINNNERTS